MASLTDRINEYRATPSGKIVVVAVPVAVLVLIVAVVALTVLNSGQPSDGGADVKTVESTATPSAAATETPEQTATPSAETTEPPINQNYEVYETRDPFKPMDSTAAPSSTAGTQSAPSSSSSSAGAGQQGNVLALKSVTAQNGVLYANVEYGTNSYVVRSGERVGDSPYQITSISSDSATFLYGDDTLMLAVGEEVQK